MYYGVWADGQWKDTHDDRLSVWRTHSCSEGLSTGHHSKSSRWTIQVNSHHFSITLQKKSLHYNITFGIWYSNLKTLCRSVLLHFSGWSQRSLQTVIQWRCQWWRFIIMRFWTCWPEMKMVKQSGWRERLSPPAQAPVTCPVWNMSEWQQSGYRCHHI